MYHRGASNVGRRILGKDTYISSSHESMFPGTHLIPGVTLGEDTMRVRGLTVIPAPVIPRWPGDIFQSRREKLVQTSQFKLNYTNFYS